MAETKENIDARRRIAEENERIQKVIKNRLSSNKMIISLLNEFVDIYPDLRFEQLLILLFGELDFNRESEETREHLSDKFYEIMDTKLNNN